ncbi:MAG: hypothetical protein ACRDUY_08100 [Nitriliruptorales bacterium]
MIPLGGFTLIYAIYRVSQRWMYGDWRSRAGDGQYHTRSPDFTSWEDPGGPS